MPDKSEHPVNRSSRARADAALDIVLGLVPPSRRASLAALMALDARLGEIVASTREPMLGQMRLTWWRDALARLDQAAAPPEPLLIRLREEVLPDGVGGGDLARLTDGWMSLLSEDVPELELYASARGGCVFALAQGLLGIEQLGSTTAAGEAWALADLSRRSRTPAIIEKARSLAESRRADAFAQRWPAKARPLGVLALLAWFDAIPSSPARQLFALAKFRLTGT